jgi:glycosyltransferase involved in cell wall biosynthesis
MSDSVSRSDGATFSNIMTRSERTQASISVVIPTYNAERCLEKCLDSLAWADEVIVVDMFSTDRTLEICGMFPNTRVHQRHDYIFANVNYGMDVARGEWIIRHDSDEIITPELRDEILEKVRDGSIEEFDGYFVADLTNHFGIWVASDIPGRGGREKLFRKGAARYAVQSEHEHPVITGRWGYLRNIYLHDSNPSLAYMLKKTIYYAERDAERADLSEARSAWYVAYRTIKAFFSTSRRLRRMHGRMERGLNPILSLLWAIKYFVEAALVWERALKRDLGLVTEEPRPLIRDFGSDAGRQVRHSIQTEVGAEGNPVRASSRS